MSISKSIAEPTFETACQWWPDLSNIWTPIGWKNHLFTFNVLYSGCLLAAPDVHARAKQYAGQGVQLSFIPHYTDRRIWMQTSYLRHDDNSVDQHWADSPAPVLNTDWAKDGVLARQRIFAHIPGGGDTTTGVEPLFAWIRLSIADVCASLPLEDTHGFMVLIENPHMTAGMSTRDNIHRFPERAAYPRPLTPAVKQYSRRSGYHLLESGDQVRLAVAPGQKDCQAVNWHEPTAEQSGQSLCLQMPTRKGATIDMLVPMLPTDRETFDAELKLGYDGALKEANAYWRKITRTKTVFEVPEQPINEAIRHSVRFSNVLTERNPATGKVCKINGSWAYAALWTTPGAMDLAMMMDHLGHHGMVAQYLDIFREEQGTVPPPSDSLKQHPGFLSTPAVYKSIDWLSDNGGVLWMLCTHALLTGDRQFTDRFTDCIVRSCEWIRDARQTTGHGGYEGVLPPAIATDARTTIQAVWSIGWNYKGLRAAVRLLKQINHPRAGEFDAEAKAYKKAFIEAFRDRCRTVPTWKDAKGKTRKLPPTSLAGDEKAETRHAFFLDTGPLFLVFSELMTAGDPLMKDIHDWFRQGPQWKLHRKDSNCWLTPVLDHEMSTCEPCYSWNVFHTWQRGDRQGFLEGMYSLFAGSLSRKTWISCETRGGITGNVFSAPLAIYMARLAVIDDRIRENELHLLRLMPLAWLGRDQNCRFESMPTEFGPVTLITKVSRNGKTLQVTFEPNYRITPKKIVLHIPPMPELQTVRVNGRKVNACEKTVVIEQTP